MAVEQLRVDVGAARVLRDVSLTFPDHEVTAIIGATGSGKTTLLRALNRLHDATRGIRVAGRVLLHGADVYHPNQNVRELRRRVGMLFQRPNPFPQSILENITVGPRSHGLARGRQLRDLAEAKLTEVGLWSAVKDRLGHSPFSLTGGQQQLLCLARALSVEPEVLLLDEPTSALDPGSTEHIEQLMAELRRHVMVILVTHNLQQANRVAGHVLFLAGGEQVEFTSARQFFSAPADKRSRDYIEGRLG